MSDFEGACPPVPLPGLIKPSPQHTFVLIVTIAYPFFVVFCLFVFWYYKNQSVYLRKRPMRWVVLTGINSFAVCASTSLYDYVGSENYPCWLLFLLSYTSIAIFNVPGLFIVLGYAYEVAALRLQQQAQLAMVSSSSHQSAEISGKQNSIDLNPEASCLTFSAFIRVVFLGNRDKSERILSAKFSRTPYVMLFWSCFACFPYPIAFLVRLGMNPQWGTCTGCELQPVDAILFMIFNGTAYIMCVLSNSAKIKRRDALRVVREWLCVWSFGTLFLQCGYILFLTDPGGIYTRGIFNWRLFLLCFAISTLYIQTVHQVLLAKYLKRKLLLVPLFNRHEQFAYVMCDRILASRFRATLDTELSGEILQFLNAVDEFKQNYNQEGSQRRARVIFDTFIKGGSRQEINIASDLRFGLTCKLTVGNVPVEVFDEAYGVIKNALLMDAFARFIQKIAQEDKNTSKQLSVGFSKKLSKEIASNPSSTESISSPAGKGDLVTVVSTDA